MVKVVYNDCFGGFSLSREAVLLARELSQDPKWDKVDPEYGFIYGEDIPRHDPILVQVVETLGDKANGSCAQLAITEVDNLYRIDEYDGNETVETPGSYEWTNPFA